MDATSSKGATRKDATKLPADGILLSMQKCPDCGAKMSETDRVVENGSIFVWYECENANCDGQWLQKYQRQMDVAV